MKRNKKNVLILTDHTSHTSENSLYDLAVKMLSHPMTEYVDIASRGNEINKEFFSSAQNSKLWATRIDEKFNFKLEDHPLSINYHEIDLWNYDLVWLRMPPPLISSFLEYVDRVFFHAIVINDPKSITRTGSKAFLMNFQTICPPMKLCSSLNEINEFRESFPIVLKPLHGYGGRGIVKIMDGIVSSRTSQWTFDEFIEIYTKNPVSYLGMKYLKNVSEGDKRIIVVNGKILGASLRLPAADSWICNVAMGGSSNLTDVTPEEVAIIKQINPILAKQGIVMYGVDTLMNDNGMRVLSEINTTSIGGLPQIAAMRNEPIVEKAVDLIWSYYSEKMK